MEEVNGKKVHWSLKYANEFRSGKKSCYFALISYLP